MYVRILRTYANTGPLGTPDSANCSLHPRIPVAKNLDFPDKSKAIISLVVTDLYRFWPVFLKNLKIDFLHYATSVDHHLSCNLPKYVRSKKGSYFGSMVFVSKF